MTTYRTLTGSLIVLPAGASILDDEATHIELADEGAGAFVTVTQYCRHESKICIDGTEWPAIRAAVDTMLAVAQGIEAATLPKAADDDKVIE